MQLIKRVFRYFLLVLLAFLLVVSGISIFYTFRYTVNVGKNPGLAVNNLNPGELGKWVNPFIGTDGIPSYTSGDDIPGPTMPFGMVRLSPDTKFFLGRMFSEEETVSTAGYFYGDNLLMGFSHTRLIGTGAYDGGHFRVIPSVDNDGIENYRKGEYHKFSHENEIAFPGYYAVKLSDSDILAELTATERVGVHRYSFGSEAEPHILIDVSSSLGKGRSSDGEVHIDPLHREISVTITTYGSFASRYGGEKVFFAAIVNKEITSYKVWSGDSIHLNQQSIQGDTLGIDLSFDSKDSSPVVLKVGISYVSTDNARLNLHHETDGLSFEDVALRAQQAWEDRLSLIRVEGGTEDQKKIFYTALYHSFQMPTVFNDVNGDYKGFDKAIHKADSFRYFTDLSLWDTFRAPHPLYALIAPQDQRDMVRSLVKMYEQGGSLPRWPSGYGYTGSMLGSSADMVIAESYLKGIRDFDVETAYTAMKDAALGLNVPEKGFKPREGEMGTYMKFHYCQADQMHEAVSKTLEYSYADDAIAKLATALGHADDAKLFAERSKYYVNLWNPENQYFHPKNASGDFVQMFDPLKLTYLDFDQEYTDDYVEGSALQWRWAVFFDAEGLVSLFKNKEYFVSELNNFFALSDPERGRWTPGSYYWHGNEPDIHAAYLFNSAGRPDLTQKWVRWIMDNKYAATYDGLDGDDDAGTLSAWYVFSALGFYPVAGSDIYQIGSPIFKTAEVKIGQKVLSIIADNYSPENIYVSKVWLNAILLDRFWFKHGEIANGGILRFEMSDKPVR